VQGAYEAPEVVAVESSRQPRAAARVSNLGGVVARAGVRILALGAVYAVAGRLGLAIAPVHHFASLVWPPAGIALAALLLGGIRLWPGVALGAFVVNWWAGAPVPVALGIAAGNTLEAVVGAQLIRSVAGKAFSFNRIRGVLAFVVLGALVSTAISATSGVFSLLLGGHIGRGDAVETWRAWWLGGVLGDLVAGSMLLAWTRSRPRRSGARQRAEAAALGGLVVAVGSIVFFNAAVTPATRFVGACLLIPLLMWGALRFGMRGATATAFLTSVISIAGTALERGPFVQNTLSGSLLHLQSFMAIVAISVLTLAAVAAERADTLENLKHRERALSESEERFRLAVESAQLGIWDLDPETGRLDWSPRCKEIFGVPLEATMSYEVFLQAVHPDDRRRTDELVQRALAEPGSHYQTEYRCIWPDGTVRWIAARGEARFVGVNGTRRAVRMLGTVLDITDRKHAEEALSEASRRKSEFLGVLSHELRNPLAAIRSALDVLRLARDGSDHASRARAVVDRQTNQLARLVEDLLDVTRISRGKIQLRRRRLDLAALARHAVEDHRTVYDSRRIALSLSADVAPLWIDADATRITQVIGNLLQNAAKFTKHHGHVGVSVERAGPSHAAIRISDDGVGIAPEALPRIFEPFTQAEQGLHRSVGGLGLGLALVKGLVEMHGGRVEARSQGLDRGSEFTISLPLVTEATAAARAPPAARRRRKVRRRVLVIEDTPDAAEMLREALAMKDHEVEVAYDGEEGLAKARAFRPDIVLCDIGLPGLDGYEVARRIRADPSLSPRLIALTGYALPEDQRRAFEAGFHQHLAKPFEIAELEEVIAKATVRAEERRVLIVDDNDALRSNIREMLEDEDWEVEEARSGAEALEVLRRFRPAVILLDYRMPDLGGDEVLQQLRASNEPARVVLMTASAHVRQLALEQGLRLYVPKPFASEDLLDTLEQAIAGS
jgi:two-component system CheB/CheR fusion protein